MATKFWSKIEILVRNRNLGQKSKFWSEIEILVPYRTKRDAQRIRIRKIKY